LRKPGAALPRPERGGGRGDRREDTSGESCWWVRVDGNAVGPTGPTGGEVVVRCSF